LTHSDASFSCSILRSEIAEMNLDYHAFEYTDEDVILPTQDEDFKEFVTSWKNPVAVGKYCWIRSGRLQIPSMVPETMKYKKDFFPRDLNYNEYIALAGRPYRVICDYLKSKVGLDGLDEFLTKYDEDRKSIRYHSSSDSSSSDTEYPDSDPDLFDGGSYLRELFSRYQVDKIEDKVRDVLPEGWELDSLEVDENIIYICENRELFDPVVIDYVNQKSNKAIIVYDDYINFMKRADPQSMYLEFLRTQLRILGRNEIIKAYIFNNMLKISTEDPAEDDDEVDFQGDFDFL
jgi:hypothetical protein